MTNTNFESERDIMGAGDKEIRRNLEEFLRQEHGDDALIIHELFICRGLTRADVAVVDDQFLHGYEIKSNKDSLKRLIYQGACYNWVFDKATIVVGDLHYDEAIKIIPDWWGIIRVEETDKGLNLVKVREPGLNPSVDPYSVAEFLWKEELVELLDLHKLGTKKTRRMTRGDLWHYVAENLPLEDLKSFVRDTFRKRKNWRNNGSQKEGEP